jgi:hypothetical protein
MPSCHSQNNPDHSFPNGHPNLPRGQPWLSNVQVDRASNMEQIKK